MSSLDSKISNLENLAQQARTAASQFTDASNSLRNQASSLDWSVEALTANPQSWSGQGSTSFGTRWQGYKTYTMNTASNLDDTATALNKLASQLESEAQKAKAAEDVAIAMAAATIAAGAAMAIFTFGASEAAADAAAAAEEAAAIGAAEVALDVGVEGVDAAVSGEIEAVIDSMVDVTDVGEEEALPSVIEDVMGNDPWADEDAELPLEDEPSFSEGNDPWSDEDAELPAEDEPSFSEGNDPWSDEDGELSSGEEEPQLSDDEYPWENAEYSEEPIAPETETEDAPLNPRTNFFSRDEVQSYKPANDVIFQENKYGCVPASMRMILNDMGKEVPEESDIAGEAGMDFEKGGGSFEQAADYFNAKGIPAKAIEVDGDDMNTLDEELYNGRSFMTGFEHGTGGHSVVVDGIDDDFEMSVLIRDPASGAYKVPYISFLQRWSNTMITFG